MAEFNWTVDDIKRAQRDFSNNFMRLDCIRTESYDVAIDCMTECIEKKAADVQSVKRGKWDFRGYQLFKCTNCKEIFTQNQLEAIQNHIDQEEFTFPNFCPNCGADMRGDTNG